MDIPRSGKEFPYVQKYKDLAQQLGEQNHHEQDCPDYFLFPDQEVPQLRSCIIDEGDVKLEVKMEANSPESHSDSLFMDIENTIQSSSSIENMKLPTFLTSQAVYEANNNILDFTTISTNNENSVPPHFSITDSYVTTLANASPLLSSTALPSYPLSDSRTMPHNANSFKSRNFVSEVAGSGCTVLTQSSKSNLISEKISNSQHFLCNDSQSSSSFLDDLTPPSMSQSIDFLDLDKHQDDLSFYEDMKPYPNTSDDELMNMFKMANDVTSTLHHDCHTLNISHDPMLWSSENVNIWVAQICQNKGYCNPSVKYHSIDGRVMCSLREHQFTERYGPVLGDVIFKELQLLQAANTCYDAKHLNQHASMNNNNEINDPLFHFPGYHVEHERLPPVSSSLPVTVGRVSPAPSTSSSQDSDQSDDDACGQLPLPSVPATGNKTGRRGHKQTIHLWQFLRELLVTKDKQENCIRWINQEAGIFKIEDSKRVAFLWGSRKNRPAMNYDKLSRSVRQYYKKGIIKKTEQSKRLVYQFCAGYL